MRTYGVNVTRSEAISRVSTTATLYYITLEADRRLPRLELFCCRHINADSRLHMRLMRMSLDRAGPCSIFHLLFVDATAHNHKSADSDRRTRDSSAPITSV